MSSGIILLLVAIVLIIIIAYLVGVVVRKRNDSLIATLEEKKQSLFALPVNVVNLMFGFDEFKAVVKIFSFKDMIFNIRKRIERKIYPFLIPFTKSCLTLTNQMKALNSFNFIVDR